MRHSLRILTTLAFVALAGVLLAGVLLAGPGDNAATSASQSTKPGAKKNANRQLSITPEREAAVLAFVERNHPELVDLLGHLEANEPKQYEQAVKEIYRVTERLATIQERDPLQYELEVKLWSAQSRVQVLAARLKMGATDEHRKQLREALATQVEARLSVLTHQREQAAERLSKMDGEIQKLQSDRQKVIDRQLETLSQTSANKGKAATGKPSGKKSPAARPQPET